MPIGFFAAMSRGLAGEQLTEMHELAEAGRAWASATTAEPVAERQLLRRALQYAKVTDRFVARARPGRLAHGRRASCTRARSRATLGLGGIPAIAESADVARALEVARYEGAACTSAT